MCRRLIYLISFVTVLGLGTGLASGRDVKINFQVAGGPIPENYLPDYGEPYGDRSNNFLYGWSRNISADARNRNSANAPDERYDTLIHLQKGAAAIWEIELPNSAYNVHLAAGDPGYTDQTDTFDVEGVIAQDPDGQAGTGFDFDEWDLTVVVTDGRLTIQPGPGAANSKILFVDILGVILLKAYNPTPKDGALHADTWVNLSWSAGDTAISHDVYFSNSFDDVKDGTGDTFRGNQTTTFFVAGFPGFPYPDGLVPGTTYYWRIDEVEANNTTKHKGDIWSFTVPPKKAYNPVPASGAESVALNVTLTWTAGFGAKLHTVYFGDNSDTVSNAAGGLPQGTATYTPSGLKMAKTYYWRVDEFDGSATHKGDIWSFTTTGAVGSPNPANGAVDVNPAVTLTWKAGGIAASHEVYFGTDADAVKNATKTSPEYKGPKALGDERYAPGTLKLQTAYYWRIDEVNTVNTDSPWKGNVWSFTTGNFFVVDDFESYDAGANQIWYSWHDGLGYGAPATPPYFAGNGTGASVGDETTASFTEQTIIHGGGKSMPLNYDNNKQGFAKYSEAEFKLTAPRDWTADGVGELSIWFRGRAGSVGSFVEGPVGTYTMTASGTDIWDVGTAGNYHDEFHFAYKTLTGAGSIIARIQSVQNTNGWAKAGVMIRETLDGGSKHAFACVTPSNGVASQGRDTTSAASFNTAQGGIVAPYWVKLERDAAGNFTVSHSANGTTWQPVTGATPRNIPMSTTVYIGLALTSHDAARTCQAVFTNVTTTGTVSPQWAHQDIGIASNAAEPLYIAVSNAAGQPAVVVHSDPKAAQITTWTEWVIPLQNLTGITLTNVDKLAIGLGTRGNMTTAGGSGKMYIDDIRLYRPRTP